MKGSETPILLVEDEADDEVLTLHALKKANLLNDVVVARDGQEALDYLFGPEAGRLPHIVLLDLGLPKVDGLEVLAKIRENERTKLLPVIILTSSEKDSDLLNGYSLGANSYVRKPVDFDQFTDAVRTLACTGLC